MVGELHGGVEVPTILDRIVDEALLVPELLGVNPAVHDAVVTATNEKAVVVVEDWGVEQTKRQRRHLGSL